MTTRQCIFCSIARDTTHEAPIYRDDRVIVIRDISPKAPVHLLIIPNMHLASLAYVGPGQVPIMGHLFVVAEEMARREDVTLSGYRLVMNQGTDSGQAIEHLHLHLLGGQPLGAMG
ncbi:MAG: HIT domain-containing protein [Dehalococcoidia bacterium]|jgi:histidine triad (HIT) family protein|nr:HIT domain-containing protein [Dehalococcoidia bacterium]MDP6227689.1 HIT domain-containing protein [Dehalococcoidia bacterium]MDP7200563.1 HIT domain-containing protein [Dehalococcoidia bacterium]MDP7511827.1 HIT domain-containing protein [Dehalococcoidia bacterium]HJN86816.1 HIT domain-containing protein [Dehalococcoidia bacterium]|tara:strand:+ start:226 stop:573 length:348 start_codon:yes stop_codon:yes gene_type:complete